MTTLAGTVGYAPKVLINPIPPKEEVNPELHKYKKLWDTEGYRVSSPGERMASDFLTIAKPKPGAEVIDFGCGSGRGGLMLAVMGGMKVKLLDFADNCLDEDVANACKTQAHMLSFDITDLTKPCKYTAEYGFCCDVMEHIPPDLVDLVLRNILASAQHVYFSISTIDDHFGATIGEKLHLTVKPLEWWVERLKAAGAIIHFKQHVVDVESGKPFAANFYCTAWKNAEELVKTGVVNVAEEQLNANVKKNIEDGWPMATPHEKQDREIILLAGGPSMNDFVDKIKELRKAGAGLVTVNGAYHWAIKNDLEPSCQVVLDAREFNSRFVEPVLPRTKYLMASQVHPSTLAKLPRDRTLIWHSGLSDENEQLIHDKYGVFYPIPGGSTVVLRAIPLIRMLGYSRIHIFGFDSCVLENGTHHAYSQPENDGQPVVPVVCGGRTFMCAPWMVSQATEFQDLVKFLGDEVELAVYGNGLIAHIIATGASFSTDSEI